jgi:hypothetical protein
MARPPLALRHHGSIKVTRDDGQWVARRRVRGLDGATQKVERWGSSRAAAQRALQDELRQRRGERTERLCCVGGKQTKSSAVLSRSDGAGKFGEGCREPMPSVDIQARS